MGNTNSRRLTARRFASVLAVLGALVMSSGIALMAAAAPATAGDHGGEDKKVDVCHATDSDTHPYDFLNISVNAVKDQGHLAHRNTPNKTWKTDGTWNGTQHAAGDPKRDFIADYDGNVLDGTFTKAWCEAAGSVDPATAVVDWTDPACANENTASYETSGEHVTWSIVTGSAAPGAYLKLKATAIAGYEFSGPGDDHKRYFEHTFGAVEDCTQFDATASVEWVEPSCQNENTPNYLPTGDHVTWEITGGSLTPGGDVEVTATADEGHAFDNESTTKVFTHHFNAAENCEIVTPPREVTPGEPSFADPTCDTDPSVTLPTPTPVEQDARKAAGPVVETADVDGVHYVVTGDLVAGGAVEVDATLIDPETTFFAKGVATHWTHTFTVPTGCESVTPPVVTPPVVSPPTSTVDATNTVVTPTLVHAGLAGSVADARAQQGLALVFAGLLLLLGAGALGLVRPRSAAARG